MSSDWVVISRYEQTHEVLIAALLEVMPESSIRTTAEETVWEIVVESDGGENPPALLAVELPRRIQNPAELQRLLEGADVSAVEGVSVPLVFTEGSGGIPSDEVIWWQDIHALADLQVTDPLANRLAHAVAGRSEGAVILPRGEAA
ncbi:hypothetical protein [Arthrobacter castelli]|uniref:hypothetical protein n=1 Tax=Arthrobacter castelli TaxID=271431 RepID=UPI0003FDE7D4|nr:hypothetical protein [Arthrobacter castelli]